MAAATRRLLPSRRGEAVSALAEAFADYPIWVYASPRAAARARFLRRFYRGALTRALGHGRVRVAGEGERIGGVAIVYGPESWPLPASSIVHEALPFVSGGPRLALRGHVLDRATERPHPPGPHLFLHTLGVHPSAQGQGLGAALIAELVAEADERGLVTHLTTSKEENVELYRRFGFELKGEERVGDGVPIWAMDRPPRPRARERG